jgi:hypothetical protein
MWDAVDAVLHGLGEWGQGKSFWWGVVSFLALSLLFGLLWWVLR